MTLDEIRRTAQWLLRARGLRCGNEDEPADAVVWLATRRSGVLAALWQELNDGALAADHPPMPPPLVRSDAQDLEADALDASALTTGMLYIDWLIAAARSGARVQVSNLRSPMWLVAHLARREAASPITVRIDVGAEMPLMIMQRDVAADLELILFEPWSQLPGRAFTLHAVNAIEALETGDVSVERIAISRLAVRAERAMHQGVQVERTLWDRMRAATSDAMVPETDESRRRGAGAEGRDFR